MAAAYLLVTVPYCTGMVATLNACGHVLQLVGRQPAELASSSFRLLVSSLPRAAARVCFLLEQGRPLPPKLNTVLVKGDTVFLRYARVTKVRTNTDHHNIDFGSC